MATITSLGLGSGLESETIVSKLMALERAPLTVLDTKAASYTSKISSYGQLKSALATLNTAATALSDQSKLAAYTASSADSTIVSATSAFNASPGTYNVSVTQLATAQKRFTNAYASNTTFGAGTIDVTINGTTKSISLNGTSNSLQDIRAAINNANTGVTAAVVSGTDGDRLILTSSQTGASGAFSVAVSSSDSNLQSIATFDASQAAVNAQDAIFSVEGISATSSSNTVSTAVNGLTLTLGSTGSTKITVSQDSSKITDAVTTFVNAYNSVVSLIKTQTAYDSSTKTAQPLNAEGSIRTIQSMLQNSRTTVPSALSSATFKTLSDIGVSIQSDGTLLLDNSKLTKALNSSVSDVSSTLGAYGKVFADTITQITSSKGIIQNRLDGIDSAQKLLEKNRTALEQRLTLIEKRYRAQFTALDTTVSSLQTIGTYLTQQLAQLSS